MVNEIRRKNLMDGEGQRDRALTDYQKALSLDPNLRPPRQAVDRLGKEF